jgi:hypothetical protein
MAFIPPRSNPNQPIPNDPFYSPETSYFVGPYYNAGIEPTSGIDIDLSGTINVTGGGGAGTVTAVTGTLPVVVANPTTTPVISINAASTAAAGVVQLSDSVSSGSSTTAASSLAVQTAYNLAAAALPTSGGTMTGPIIFAAGQTIPITTLPVATTSSLGIVQVGSNISVSAGTISVASASTSAAGVVQLSDSISSGSSTTAASSLAVKTAYDLAAAALPLSGGTMTGPITFAAGQTIPITTLPVATTTSQGIVQIGTNINVSSGTISVASASTSAAGVVQLNDTVASTSTTQALTAAQGKALQDQIDALAVAGNIILAGTIDASTGNLVTVTADGTAAGFAAGSPLPAAAAGNTDYFVIVTIPGTMTPPGGSAQVCHQGDWWLSNGTTWSFLDVGFNASYATTTTPGIVTLSTDAATQTGTNATLAVTPTSLQSKVSDSTSTTSSTAIASSTAVKTAYDLAAAAIPKSTLTTKGDLISSTAASTPTALTVGTDGQVLTADSTCATGLKWAAGGGGGASVPCAAYTAKGVILAGTAVGSILTFGTLVGGTGYTPGTYTLPLVGGSGSGATATITVGVAGVITNVVLVTGGSGYTVGDSLTALTTAGTPWSIPVATVGEKYAALPVGSDGQYLVADSTCATGLKWAAGGGSAATPTVPGIVLGCTMTTTTALGCNVGSVGLCSVHIGTFAGCANTTGAYNTYAGYNAGRGSVGTFNNVMIGYNAGCTGPSFSNTFVGATAGQAATSAHCGSVLIGTQAGQSLTGNGCQIVIGWRAGSTSSASWPGNNIVIGACLNPTLTVNCAMIGRCAGACAAFNLTSGTGWTFTSDSRVKDGITALPAGGEAFINALRPVAYCFLDRETKEPLDYQHCNVGFIAQEVERALMDNGLEHISNLVGPPVDDDSYYNLTETSMLPFLVKAFQELSAKVTALEAKLAE